MNKSLSSLSRHLECHIPLGHHATAPLTMCKHEKAQSGVIGAFIISILALRRMSESGPKRNEERGREANLCSAVNEPRTPWELVPGG